MSKNSMREWKSNIGQPYYINISQLSMLAARLNYPLDDFNKVGQINKLSDLGIELATIILAFKKLVNTIKPVTQSFTNLKFNEIKQDYLIEFSDRFNSKNSRQLRENTYKLGDEPHLWKKYGDYKVVMNMNPKWVTTDTACSSLSRNAEFAGLCLVKQIDSEQSTIYATPLLIGIPRNLDIFEGLQGNI
ncbi:hypothetical protein FQP34_00200 [Peribacillus simplex]|uniref:Uncharacterized protein n=1 Tax=Peribacillus simplex TaxID=1478 RepID=A0A8B5Y3J3_9BACI|nr:hypothetical protein [Peribacillus simplex]TVX83712.1 hypothetical protein FQP34_00200 [Peribacillus simplex]